MRILLPMLAATATLCLLGLYTVSAEEAPKEAPVEHVPPEVVRPTPETGANPLQFTAAIAGLLALLVVAPLTRN